MWLTQRPDSESAGCFACGVSWLHSTQARQWCQPAITYLSTTAPQRSRPSHDHNAVPTS